MSISTTPASGPTPHKEVKPPVTSSQVKANEQDSASTNSAEVQDAVEDGADADKVGRLAGFLQSQKDEFVADLKEGKGKGWIVVMGNEAGDLDSLASSIAYAQLSSALLGLRVISLVLTPSSLMSLRPENLLAFKNAHLPISSLLHLDSLPVPASNLSGQGVRFALVDHNKLLPMFGPVSPGLVQGVIDHHDDEKAHEDAEIRLVQVPTGSASSLVTKHFMPQWQASLSGPAGSGGSPVPSELATLLLSAQLIDTHGLKADPKGKGTPTDMEAAAFLYPLTPWAAGASVSASEITASSLKTSVPPALAEQSGLLSEAKFNVSYLSTHDLLFRDYKEYELPTASSAFPTLRVGLSTVPLGLKAWLERDGDWKSYLAAADAFTAERKLDVEGVLTTFKSAKGKNKREVLLLVRVGGALDERAAKRVMRELEEGLERDQELQLEPWDKKGWKRFLSRKKRAGLDGQGRYGRVWQQGNAQATRKKVAPIMRDLVAKLT